MPNKVPVGATIARAYRFAFLNILNNLGAIWIPVAILWLATYLFSASSRQIVAETISRDPHAVLRAFPFLLVSSMVVFILLTSQIAALTKEALGLRTGASYLQIPFGAPMWRLLACYILLTLTMIAIYIAILLLILVGGILLALLAGLFPTASSVLIVAAVGILGGAAIFCAVIYIGVRLSFLIAPVAVAEARISLIRTWELSRGNFWRMFAILLAVVVPFIVVYVVYVYSVYGNSLIPPIGAAATPDALAQWQQHEQQISLSVMDWSQHYWFITYPVGLLFAVIVYGLWAGASAFAYRALLPAAAVPGSA